MKNRQKFVIGIIIGAVLHLSLLAAYLFGYRPCMKRAEAALIAPGTADSTVVSSNISTMLYTLTAGCAGTLVGIIVFMWSSIRYRRAVRAEDNIPSAY